VPGVLHESLFRVGMLRLAGALANTAIIGATAPAAVVADWDGEQWRRTEPQQDPDDEKGDQSTCHLIHGQLLAGGTACRCPGCRNW